MPNAGKGKRFHLGAKCHVIGMIAVSMEALMAVAIDTNPLVVLRATKMRCGNRLSTYRQLRGNIITYDSVGTKCCGQLLFTSSDEIVVFSGSH